MKTLLIIPAHNEAESLPSLLEELKDFPQYDIVVVDDCSFDETAQVANTFNVPVLRLPINLGLSGAVQTGMLYATTRGYDICIQIDGDGQHIPEEIEKLVHLIEHENVDIAIGSRFLKGEAAYDQSFLRRAGANHITRMIKIFSGVHITDPTSGMRAFSREYFSRMAHSTNNRPEPDTILQFAREGAKIQEVEVKMRERIAGESYLTLGNAGKYMIENTLSFFYIVAKTKRNKNMKEEK